MTLWTLAQIKTKIQNDLDLTDEVMITSAELTAYINQAIDEAEQHVLAIYEDYFLQSANLALVSGTSEYSFPSNIYAHKVRRIFYENGTNKYEIRRIRDLSEIPDVETGDNYRYIVMMNSSGAAKIKLYPTAAETSSTNVTVWFIGNATTLSATSDEMNIPEAVQYVIARAKLECARKEGHPAQVSLADEVKKQEKLLVDTLTAMVPDEDNEIRPDFSFYNEFDSEIF